jgi:hypothetical protein
MHAQVRNTVDMYPDYDKAEFGLHAQGPKPGSFPPLSATLQCGSWLSLARLVCLDFSQSDRLEIQDLRWATLTSLRTLRLNDIKRLVLRGCDDLAELAALPDLALVDVRQTVPGDARSMVLLFNLALSLQALGRGARFLM